MESATPTAFYQPGSDRPSHCR